jgi:hypothetical protein
MRAVHLEHSKYLMTIKEHGGLGNFTEIVYIVITKNEIEKEVIVLFDIMFCLQTVLCHSILVQSQSVGRKSLLLYSSLELSAHQLRHAP